MISAERIPNMHDLRLFILSALVLISPPVFAQESIEKYVLDNGLTVIIQPLQSSQAVSIYALVKAGSSTEGEFLGKGISHFVEHMLFKGTVKRKVGEIPKEVKSIGGRINAWTDLDSTMYTLDVPKNEFIKGLDIISDMLMNSAFDPVQVEKEREVIHGEMRLYKDRPERRLSANVFRNVYIRHPYRHPTIGYEPLFDSITRDELYNYYRAKYIPNNIVLSIAGPVDPVLIRPLIQKAFEGFKQRPYPLRNLDAEQPQMSPRYYEEYYQTPLFRFSLAYPSVALADPDMYALDVLAMAISNGESSRLYKDVYKKRKLVKSITASNYTPADKGIFEIEGVMDQDNLDPLIKAVKFNLEDIKRRGLTADELAKIKRQVYAQFVYSRQTSSNLASRAALDEAFTGDVQFYQYYSKAVKQVSNEDIKRVAQKYFVDSALSVTVLKPLESKPVEKEKSKNNLTLMQRIILDNGLTVLLKEDKSVGVSSVLMLLKGGVNQETALQNGISQLLAQAWTRGNKNKSEEQLLKEMELRGVSINAFAGRNSWGMTVNSLSEDLPFAIDTLTDTIQLPAFKDDILAEEKDKMYTAIDAREDDVKGLTLKKLLETLFKEHPARLDQNGSKETLKDINSAIISQHYRRFMTPDNMVIAVAGNFNSTQVLNQIKKRFSSLAKSNVVLKKFTEAPPSVMRVQEIKVPKQQAVVAFSFQAPVMGDKDRYAMEHISTILGSGLGGRLFVKIRDELGKAYTVGAWYTPYSDMGTFTLFVLTTNDKIDTVKDIFIRELSDLQANIVTDQEFKDAKAFLKGSFNMSLSTSSAIAYTAAIDELFGLGFQYYEKHDALIDAVTKDDIRRVAVKYLDISKSAIVMTRGEALKQ